MSPDHSPPAAADSGTRKHGSPSSTSSLTSARSTKAPPSAVFARSSGRNHLLGRRPLLFQLHLYADQPPPGAVQRLPPAEAHSRKFEIQSFIATRLCSQSSSSASSRWGPLKSY